MTIALYLIIASRLRDIFIPLPSYARQRLFRCLPRCPNVLCQCPVSNICQYVSICYYHLQRLFRLRSVVSQDVMKHLVTALVLARIDSCNSVLVNLPASTIALLQRVQNTAARLVLGLKRRAHITPALKKLHWLPVRQRIFAKPVCCIEKL